MTYDAVGNLLSTRNPLGFRTTYTYDAVDQQTSSTNPLGGRVTTLYDLAGRVKSTTNELGNRTTYTYDAADQMIAVRAPQGFRDPTILTTTIYDAVGRTSAIENALGNRTTFGYDAAGQRTMLQNALGNRTTFQYDPVGNTTTEIDPLARRTTFTYSPINQRASKHDARNSRVTYVYDPVGQLTGQRFSDNIRYTFTYDGVGNRLTMQDKTGTTSYLSTPRNEVESVTQPVSGVISYVYDAVGNRTRMAVPHSPTSYKTTYTYDKANQLITLIDRNNGRTTFQYDSLGREQSYQHANGALTTWSYDAASQVTNLEQLTSGGSALYAVTYTYDRVGNRRQQLGTDGNNVVWTYDNTSRLASERRTGTAPYHLTHTYDPVGNRLVEISGASRTTYTYDVANQLHVSVDPAGNRTTYSYDGAGNLIEERQPSLIRDFGWSVDNRLVVHDTETTRQYNADGLLVKTESPSATRALQWDGQNLLTDTYGDSEGDQTSVFVQTPDLYGRLLVRYGDSGSGSYLFDALGSTIALTDGSSNLASYVYQAYGKIVSATGSAAGNPFTWIGRYGYYRDSMLSLVASEPYYYVRARYYGSRIARWLSQDPMGYDASPWNLFEYVNSRAVSFIDPSGTAKWRANIVAKSFINGVAPIGAIVPDRAGGALPDWLDSIVDLDPLAGSTATLRLHVLAGAIIKNPGFFFAFFQNPVTDAKDGKYRLYTRTDISICNRSHPGKK